MTLEEIVREAYRAGAYACADDEGMVWQRDPSGPAPAPAETEDQAVARLVGKLSQRIVIEWEPYEHADARTVEKVQGKLLERIHNLIGGGMAADVQHIEVHSNDALTYTQTWTDWR